MSGAGAGRRRSVLWTKAVKKTRAVFHTQNVLMSVPHGIDSSTFLGYINPEIREAVPLMHAVGEDNFLALLSCVVTYMKDKPAGEAAVKAVAGKMGVKAAIRNKTLVSVVQRDLAAMNLPGYAVKAFVAAVRARRFELEEAALEHATGLPSLVDLQWRVDVSISTTHLARAMRPTVLMQMTLSDGNIKTFEVPAEKFNELRYNVAKVLKEMTDLERHPVLKLAFDLDKQMLDEKKGPAE